MRIAFDALPLLGQMTGIGWCEAGQVKALTRLFPEDDFALQYFYLRGRAQREAQLSAYSAQNMTAKGALCSAYGYRLLTSLLPLPYRLFFGKDADVTHFFNYIVPPGVHGKTVVTVHDMVYRTYPETVRSRTRHMLDMGLTRSMERADRIVTDSEFSRQEIIRYYPRYAEKIRVVPCGVDCERFRPERDPAATERVKQTYGIKGDYFLYLGTLEPRKNLERLIDAYAAFAGDVNVPPRLVLAGGKGWLYEGIFQKVQSLGLSDRVVFTQYVASEDMCALMSGALAFTFPSLYEGFGMPPLEAMACGTPVLSSDAASLPEVTGDCAVIVKAEDVSSIADGLRRLYADPALRQRLSREGLERAKGFSWDKSARMLMDVYKEIANG